MTKYSKAAQEKVHEVMDEYKKGKLKSGSGRKVKNRQQAVAIGISEAREEGLKVPGRKSSSKSSSSKSSGRSTSKKKS